MTDTNAINVSPVWMPDSRHLLFVSNQDGSFDVYQVRLDNSGKLSGTPVRLTTGLNAHTVSLSADGRTLAYSLFIYYANIWCIRIPDNGPISITEAEPVTTGNEVIESMGVLPDGKWLAFDTHRTGSGDIYKMRLPDGVPIRLTDDPAGDFSPSWSADGTEITFHSFRNGTRDIYVMSADGRAVQQVTDGPAQDRFQDWSPNGNQIVFHSDRTGRQELYIVSRENKGSVWGAPRQLTFDIGDHPRWSPDGRLIAYTCLPDNSLRVISPDGATPPASLHQTGCEPADREYCKSQFLPGRGHGVRIEWSYRDWPGLDKADQAWFLVEAQKYCQVTSILLGLDSG